VRFAFIAVEKALFKIAVLCRVLQVSRSGFYAWLTRPQSKRALEDERLKVLVHQAHLEGRRNYGRPKVHEALKKSGEHVSAKRVDRLMREEGLRGKIRRAFTHTTDSNHSKPIFPNILNREFTATAPNQRWVADISVPQQAA